MGVYGIHNALVLQRLGMGLDRKIRPLDIREISSIGIQMLSAVEELHMSSMLHRCCVSSLFAVSYLPSPFISPLFIFLREEISNQATS
jgi:hypothetical protein